MQIIVLRLLTLWRCFYMVSEKWTVDVSSLISQLGTCLSEVNVWNMYQNIYYMFQCSIIDLFSLLDEFHILGTVKHLHVFIICLQLGQSLLILVVVAFLLTSAMEIWIIELLLHLHLKLRSMFMIQIVLKLLNWKMVQKSFQMTSRMCSKHLHFRIFIYVFKVFICDFFIVFFSVSERVFVCLVSYISIVLWLTLPFRCKKF